MEQRQNVSVVRHYPSDLPLASHQANPPEFLYSKSEIVRRREAVGIDDVRDLVLHIVADAPPPSWVRVKVRSIDIFHIHQALTTLQQNPQSINKVVAILIPGLTTDLLSIPSLPTSATSNPNVPIEIPSPITSMSQGVSTIASTFSHTCPTRAPGEQTRMHSVLGTFFQVPVSGDIKKRRMQERITLERTQEKSPSRYVLSLEDMIENNYPIPSYLADVFEKPPGWVETPKAPDSDEPPSAKSRVLAIDCEMCETEEGKVLARVCIIDYASGITVYDQLVKPESPITDYLTRWSGITPESLATATTTFSQVQSHILTLLSAKPTPVLLGHSLESDLNALKICHPICIDTALIYHHPRGKPMKPGLAWLTKKWCGREIQNRGEGGHNPEEDARACIDLLKKKVENGAGFGEFKTDQESIFERMARAKNGTIRSAVVDRGNPSGWHGAKATTAIACKTDEDVLNGLLDVIPTHSFAFGRFTALADALGWITPKPSDSPPEASPTKANVSPPPPLDLTSTLTTLNTQLKTLFESLPRRTAIVLFSGHSNPLRMAELNARKNAFETAMRVGTTEGQQMPTWTSADARELEAEVVMARRGLLFLAVKDRK
ncbi:hypothetical protein NLI96_g5876 [Meripilus lineatus]|uniref:Exonuclease domain-containing protein n=1 Tax=Meripilus lineatus TaxID=2056292 RepID=A0AAD5V400_9APHY|nr:hypothetical protein NLI96_g5876 [Physisporinus lineatus]